MPSRETSRSLVAVNQERHLCDQRGDGEAARAGLGWAGRRDRKEGIDRRMMLRVAGGGLGRQGSSPFLSGDKIP